MVSPFLNTQYGYLTGHNSTVVCLRMLPNGWLASGAASNDIRIWNVSSGASTTFNGHTGSVLSLDVLANGNLVSGSMDKTFKVWNMSSGQVYTSMINASVYVVKTINSCYFATGGNDSLVKVKHN